MAKNSTLHRILSYLKHSLTAWNTTGEGIHSPYLFELVRFVLRDENSFYCFAGIERQRELLSACPDSIEVVDFGSAGSPEGTVISRRICEIASTHLESPLMAQSLFRIVNFLTQKSNRPLNILELGTSLGITTAYLASASSSNHVVTYEGSSEVLRIAKGVWRQLQLENIQSVEGNIDNTLLSSSCSANHSVAVLPEVLDFVYIDANHTYDATMRYFHFLSSKMPEKGIMVLDDIHYSEEMERAWQRIKDEERVTTSIDLYHMGILFFDSHYLKRHYIIHL
jgi:predicted O-methyltransferase YrrM